MSDRLVENTVAVLGFGNQGEAQAHLLRASGCDVVIGARSGGASASRAVAQGYPTLPIPDAAAQAQVVAMLLPDEVVPGEWPEIARALREDVALVFAHGFNLLYGHLPFPAGADVVLVSPAGPGATLRRLAERGARLPAYAAVHLDRSGRSWELAEAWARRLRLHPLLRTSVREETEVDLFGEQTVLCGGMNALVSAAFDTLVAAGYSPEMAYLECVHQLAALAELLRDRGPRGFREAISATALYGDVTRGPRVVGAASRAAMREILEEIRSGAFATEWLAEVARRGPRAARAPSHVPDPMEAARQRALGAESAPPDAPPESRNALSKN